MTCLFGIKIFGEMMSYLKGDSRYPFSQIYCISQKNEIRRKP